MWYLYVELVCKYPCTYLLCGWRYLIKITPDFGDILIDYPQTNSIYCDTEKTTIMMVHIIIIIMVLLLTEKIRAGAAFEGHCDLAASAFRSGETAARDTGDTRTLRHDVLLEHETAQLSCNASTCHRETETQIRE